MLKASELICVREVRNVTYLFRISELDSTIMASGYHLVIKWVEIKSSSSTNTSQIFFLPTTATTTVTKTEARI